MKSLNVIFPEKLKVDVIREDVPKLKDDEVLCKAEISLISVGTEMRCLMGVFDSGTNWSGWVKYPFKPGYCITGTVVEVGKDVKSFKPGDRIVTQQTHSQYFIDKCNSSNLMKIPDKVSFEEASWQPLGAITQIGTRRAEIKLGETVGVIGLGMLGQLVVQYLRMSGVRKIIAIDMKQKRLELAKKHGVSDCLAIDVNQAKDVISELSDHRMLDVVFDITGMPTILSSATQLVKRLGKVIILGDNTVPSKQFLGPNVVSDSISILGVHGSLCPDVGNEFNPWTWKEMSGLFFDYIIDGRMDVESITTDRYSPLEAEKVYNWLYNDRPDNVGITFDWTSIGE